MDGDKVRCADCGFLAWRIMGDDNSPWFEVSENSRKSGERAKAEYHYAPKCYARVKEPCEGGEQKLKTVNAREKGKVYLEVIEERHVCGKFCEYQPGTSPERHAEMQALEEVKRLAADREDRMLAHQAAEAEKARRWQDERDQRQEKQAEKERKTKLVLWVLGGVGAVLFTAGGFVGSKLYDRAFEKKDQPQQVVPATKP